MSGTRFLHVFFFSLAFVCRFVALWELVRRRLNLSFHWFVGPTLWKFTFISAIPSKSIWCFSIEVVMRSCFSLLAAMGRPLMFPKQYQKVDVALCCFVFMSISPRTVTANRVSTFILHWARTAKSRVGAGPVGTKFYFRYCRPQYRLPLLWPELSFWDPGISSSL
jgi:hypothetical protein